MRAVPLPPPSLPAQGESQKWDPRPIRKVCFWKERDMEDFFWRQLSLFPFGFCLSPSRKRGRNVLKPPFVAMGFVWIFERSGKQKKASAASAVLSFLSFALSFLPRLLFCPLPENEQIPLFSPPRKDEKVPPAQPPFSGERRFIPHSTQGERQ